MSHVLTLICNRSTPVLTPSFLTCLRDIVDPGMAAYLEQDCAVEFVLPDPDMPDPERQKNIRESIRERLGGAAVDVVVQPAAGRRKKLLVADMDSTIIEQECLDELADFAGVKEEVSAITDAAMRGDIDFRAAFEARLALLTGLPEACLEKTLTERITLTAGAHELVSTMNAQGAMTALVSGGFTYFTHRIAQAVGFLDNQGNMLAIEGGKLTGRIEGPVLGRAAKRDALLLHCDAMGISPDEAMAVGDGANDLDMLACAGCGIAFRAKPDVSAAADIRIDHADLTALLFIQGIPRSAFAVPPAPAKISSIN